MKDLRKRLSTVGEKLGYRAAKEFRKGDYLIPPELHYKNGYRAGFQKLSEPLVQLRDGILLHLKNNDCDCGHDDTINGANNECYLHEALRSLEKFVAKEDSNHE